MVDNVVGECNFGKADCLSPNKGKTLLATCQDQGWPRHHSRHAKKRGGQGMAQGKALQGLAKAIWVMPPKLLRTTKLLGRQNSSFYWLK